MDVLWDLLIAKPNTPKMAVLIRDKIGDISPESPSHRAGVLKVAMKKKFELEKKEEQYTGVRLTCPNCGCTRDIHPGISRSEIGTGVICQLCFYSEGERFYFRCDSCWIERTGDYAWCLDCVKWFE